MEKKKEKKGICCVDAEIVTICRDTDLPNVCISRHWYLWACPFPCGIFVPSKTVRLRAVIKDIIKIIIWFKKNQLSTYMARPCLNIRQGEGIPTIPRQRRADVEVELTSKRGRRKMRKRKRRDGKKEIYIYPRRTCRSPCPTHRRPQPKLTKLLLSCRWVQCRRSYLRGAPRTRCEYIKKKRRKGKWRNIWGIIMCAF